MIMIIKIKNFWIESYTSNKKAFYLEIISFFCAITASFYLALTAQNPNMTLVYPIFFIAAFCSSIAHYKRKVAFPLLLTMYFCVVNVFGFGRSIDIW